MPPYRLHQAIKILNMIKVFGKAIRVNKASQDKRQADVGANLFIGNLDPDVDEKVREPGRGSCQELRRRAGWKLGWDLGWIGVARCSSMARGRRGRREADPLLIASPLRELFPTARRKLSAK